MRRPFRDATVMLPRVFCVVHDAEIFVISLLFRPKTKRRRELSPLGGGLDLDGVDLLDPRLDLHVPLLLSKLHKLLPRLEVLLGRDLALIGIGHLGVLAGSRLLALGLKHNDGGSALGAGGDIELGARLDVEIGDAVLLAEDGEVHDDVHGGDVASDNDKAGDIRQGRRCGLLDGSLLDGLLALLDTAVDGLKLSA